MLAAGCSGPGGGADAFVFAGLERDGEASAQAASAPVVIEGRQVEWSELRPLLSEAGGAAVLEEVALDALLERQLERSGRRLEEGAVQRERELLLRAIAGEGAGEEVRERLLEQVRRQRGLGPRRFERLVRRNAMLRSLVGPEVRIEEEDVRRAFELVFGPKVRARLIVLGSRRELEGVLGELRGLDGGREEAFAARAKRSSVDPSGALGGLLEPFHLEDPAYPRALRRALGEVEPGQMTPIVELRGMWAVGMLVERVEAEATTFDAERGELSRRLRLREERNAMEALAQRLVGSAKVDIGDASLRWAWRSREGR